MIKIKEIKFRAVIPERNAVIHFTLADLANPIPLFSIREILFPWLAAGNVPDESSNVKDKNGKEIYEGDICHDEHEHMNVTGVVRWLPKKAMFRLTIDDSGYGYPLEVAPDYYTVLGNIHETPELVSKL